MPIMSFGGLDSNASLPDIIDHIAKLQKTLDYLLQGGLDSKNAREFGGFIVNLDSLKHRSGIVGMSSAGTAPESIRFWAGSSDAAAAPFRVTQAGYLYSTRGAVGGFVISDTSLMDAGGSVGFSSAITGGDDVRIWAGSNTPETAPFRVTESGAGFASNFTVEGGVIRTAALNAQRIELSGGSFKGYTADNLLSGLVFDPNTVNDIVDLFLYHRGAKLAEFFDNITSYRFRGTSDSTGFGLGGTAATTFAFGTWDFLNSPTLTGIPISAITDLENRLYYLEYSSFVNARRVGGDVLFDSKIVSAIDSVDVTG